MNLTTIPTPELQFLIAAARKELQSRKEFYQVCEYSHTCNSKGMFHRKQYKHWAKLVENITDDPNARAFEGTWLNIYKPNRITQGDWILEYQGCKNRYRFFKTLSNDEVTGYAENFVDFRKQCQKLFFYDKSE